MAGRRRQWLRSDQINRSIRIRSYNHICMYKFYLNVVPFPRIFFISPLFEPLCIEAMTMTYELPHTPHWYFVWSKCIIIWYLVETNYCLCFSPRRTRTQFESKIEITPKTRTSTTMAEMCKGHQRNGEKFPVPKYVSGKQVSIGIALAFSCATKPSHATFIQSRAKRWKRDGAAERMNGKKVQIE